MPHAYASRGLAHSCTAIMGTVTSRSPCIMGKDPEICLEKQLQTVTSGTSHLCMWKELAAMPIAVSD